VYSTHKDTGRPIVELPEEGVALQDVERALVESALARTAGNVTEAARLLRMSRGSLRYRLEKMGLRERASRRRGRPMRRRRAA
jgi:DNA-binding NtrC family response regulator